MSDYVMGQQGLYGCTNLSQSNFPGNQFIGFQDSLIHRLRHDGNILFRHFPAARTGR